MGDKSGGVRATSFRHRLLLLTFAAMVPLALACGLALGALLDEQAARSERNALDFSRALASSVDTELRLTVSALQALALVPAMADEQQLAQARRLAVDALSARPEWRAVLLLRPSGEVAFSTGVPPGARQNSAVDPASLDEVVRTRQPVVGSMVPGPAGNLGIPVRVPVLQDGALRYVLTAVVRPDSIQAVVARQPMPADWIVSVFDSRGIRIARSRDPDRYIGQPIPPELARLASSVAGGAQAFGVTITAEGVAVHTAVSRLALGHWSIALGLPTSILALSSRTSALAYGIGLVLSATLALFAAWRSSRGIERPMEQLRQRALALGRGESVEPVSSDINEIRTLSAALVASAGERERHANERERLLQAEREARAAAELAQRRSEILVRAGAELSTPLDEQDVLDRIAALVVPGVADACRIDLLDAHGVLQRRITHHVDPERRRALEEFVARNVAPSDTPGTFPWAIATGRTFLAEFPAASSADPTLDPVFREFTRIVGLRALFVVPLIARGQTLGAMAVMQAGSGRRLAEADTALATQVAQRAALALDNARLVATLRSANQQKDDFLAILGHELRNPLAPIVTSLAIMARQSPGHAPTERQIIERQVRHLSRLVDDLLDTARISSGKVELKVEDLDLRHVVHRSVELAQPAYAGRAPVRVQVPDAAVHVRGDPTRLAQVFCNLLVNAAKFSPADRPVDVALRCVDGQAVVSVRDRGYGISPELMPRIFDRFVQGGQDGLHRGRGGLGLGLAIARNLAELHGGSIEADSPGPDLGSCFTVSLPLTAGALPQPRPAEATQPADRRPMRLLLVDDNLDAVELLGSFMQMEGHEVRTASTAMQALEILEGYVPHAAVVDIGLPQMDGYQFATALRTSSRWRAIRLIALTGYGQPEDRRKALAAGFDVHLVKPADPADLLEALSAPA